MICLLKATVLSVVATSVASMNWLLWPSLIVFALVIKLIICHFELKKSESKGDTVVSNSDELRKMFKDEAD